MGKRDTIRMSLEEIKRVSVINQAIEKLITRKKAASLIGVSERQIRRLIKRVREEGDAGVIHRLRGKLGNRRVDDEIRNRAIKLYHEKYWGFGPTFASEMVQMDGSHHNWLEERGPWLIFMGYIDDATGITFGRFYDYEGTVPAIDSFRRYIQKYGLPLSIYLDKHSTYKSTRGQTVEEQLRNEVPMSQFERAMKELGVRVIHANSPQAKGRVERGFRTHQDRLIKEMRLAGIRTKDEANEFLETYYLPEHNKKFSISSAKKADLHRKPPGKEELEKILCLKTVLCISETMARTSNTER